MKKCEIEKISYHRNGLGGLGFNVVLFKFKDEQTSTVRNMVATVFEEEGACAVLDRDMAAESNIESGNSWNGDDFEPGLRIAIDKHRRCEALRLCGWTEDQIDAR